MKLGFTGTSKGMSIEQKQAVENLVRKLKPTAVFHGDCVGADATFHSITKKLKIPIEIYPPINSKARAFCSGAKVHPKGEYLDRNKSIVNSADILIATPKGFVEELRSGTWSTVRYATRSRKMVYVIFPDGKTSTLKNL